VTFELDLDLRQNPPAAWTSPAIVIVEWATEETAECALRSPMCRRWTRFLDELTGEDLVEGRIAESFEVSERRESGNRLGHPAIIAQPSALNISPSFLQSILPLHDRGCTRTAPMRLDPARALIFPALVGAPPMAAHHAVASELVRLALADVIVVVEPEPKPTKAVQAALRKELGDRQENERKAVAKYEVSIKMARALANLLDRLRGENVAADVSPPERFAH
jgi:hypothetical protein